MARRVVAADLFCGAGGSSTGLAQACAASGRRLDLTAINHWPTAVETHAGGDRLADVDDPLDTVTTKDRFALVTVNGELALLDVLFRMLQPHELAAAMGFPADYKFSGNRGEQVKQIGNAIEVNQARSLTLAALARAA